MSMVVAISWFAYAVGQRSTLSFLPVNNEYCPEWCEGMYKNKYQLNLQKVYKGHIQVLKKLVISKLLLFSVLGIKMQIY